AVQADQGDVVAGRRDARVRYQKTGADHHRPDAAEEEHDQDGHEVLEADDFVVQAQPEEPTYPAVLVRVRERAHPPAEQSLEGVVQEADAGEEGYGGEDVPEDDPGVLVIA